MKCSLLTVSFRGDFPWLPFLLKSVAKYATGFHEHVIAIPDKDLDILKTFGLTKEKIAVFSEDGFASPFMAHQLYVMCADHFCTGDVVVNIDSDCLFNMRVSPETYIQDGKIQYLMTKYGPTCDSPWRPGVENILQFPVEYEYMRRHGNSYPIEMYKQLRDYVEKVHNKSLADIIRPMGRKANLSEFNVLGAYAHKFMPERFRFIDTDLEPRPPEPIFQSWSHLLRIGHFGGDVIAHLRSLVGVTPPQYSEPAVNMLKQLETL